MIAAENGPKGLDAISALAPDVILCDYDAGIEWLRCNRDTESNAATSQIPFIYLTALGEKSEVQIAMEMGADAYVIKPFNVNELLGAIHKCLNIR